MGKQYYELFHTVPFTDDYHEFIRFIGIFSSQEKAVEAIKILKSKPGFSEYPDNFYIGDAKIDTDSWVEGFIDD